MKASYDLAASSNPFKLTVRACRELDERQQLTDWLEAEQSRYNRKLWMG